MFSFFDGRRGKGPLLDHWMICTYVIVVGVALWIGDMNTVRNVDGRERYRLLEVSYDT